MQLGAHLLAYTLRRSARRTIGFQISDEGLRITAPKWVSIADIETAILEKQRWIFGKLQERKERQERIAQLVSAPQSWGDGFVLPYLGSNITLRLQALRTKHVAYDSATRELTLYMPFDTSEKKLKDHVRLWFQTQAKILFAERLDFYADKLGVTYESLALSSAKTQWGSCSSHGHIRLNWRLMHFPLPLIDYVVAHELAHRLEMNHSPRFWATLGSIYPDYQAAKKNLRQCAQELHTSF